jgi:hypothetical protein
MFVRCDPCAALRAKLKHVVSFGALVAPLKKKRDPADAGVIEAAIDKRLAITIAPVTFHINLGLDMDSSQNEQRCEFAS